MKVLVGRLDEKEKKIEEREKEIRVLKGRLDEKEKKIEEKEKEIGLFKAKNRELESRSLLSQRGNRRNRSTLNDYISDYYFSLLLKGSKKMYEVFSETMYNFFKYLTPLGKNVEQTMHDFYNFFAQPDKVKMVKQ